MLNLFKLSIIVLFFSVKSVSGEIISINSVQIKELMAANVPLIDVRREDEWKSTGIIENSHLITFFDKNGNYDFSNFVMLLSKVDNSIENVILFCRTGRRTTVIAKALEKTGKFGKIYNTKGIKMWATGNNTLKSYQK